LGKALELLVAEKIAYVVEQYGLLSRKYFSSLEVEGSDACAVTSPR
jgi:hypothetical protein